jgi:hypothetical protein
MGETRKQLKQRLQRTGLWLSFLDLRDQLKREGQAPRQAHEEALAQIESRPPQPAAANPSPFADGEQNQSDLLQKPLLVDGGALRLRKFPDSSFGRFSAAAAPVWPDLDLNRPLESASGEIVRPA